MRVSTAPSSGPCACELRHLDQARGPGLSLRALDRFWADLPDAHRCLASERLGLASAWLQVEAATKEARSQAEAAAAKSREEAASARAARDDTLVEATAAAKRCGEAEASLKALQEEQDARTQQLQQLEDDLKAREVKFVDRDSALTKVGVEQAVERKRLGKLQ